MKMHGSTNLQAPSFAAAALSIFDRPKRIATFVAVTTSTTLSLYTRAVLIDRLRPSGRSTSARLSSPKMSVPER